MSERDDLDLLASVAGDDPSLEFVDRLRRRLHAEMAVDDPSPDSTRGGPTMVTLQQPEERRRSWAMIGAAAAVVAIAVGGILAYRGDDAGSDASSAPPATTTTAAPAVVPPETTITPTTVSPTTVPTTPAIEPPIELTELVAAINDGDAERALELVAPDAVLDGGPLGWPGYALEREYFESGIGVLAALDGSITIESCATGERPRILCAVTLDHAGYQALGGPATAELEVEVADGAVVYWKLSNDSRYEDLRRTIVEAEQGVSDSVIAAACTDSRFNDAVCADMVLRNLDALRAAAGS
jgi:hypothetical protein